MIVPVGISFYTFQTLSYSIDIFRGSWRRRATCRSSRSSWRSSPSSSPVRSCGRSTSCRSWTTARASAAATSTRGCIASGWGWPRRFVIADVLGGLVVDPVYANPESYSAGVHLLALYGFTFQIYFDFSGYSDIAIGAARLFSFRLPENFDLPYQSQSIREFWRRWHISLSSWVRDYIFFPLADRAAASPS